MGRQNPTGASEQPPPEASAAAASHQLGTFISAFGPNPIRSRRKGAILAGAIGVIAIITLFTEFWPLGIVMLLGFGLAAVQFARSFSITRSPQWIYLYEHGFIHTNRPAGPTVYRWDQISAVYQAITKHLRGSLPSYTTHVFTVDGPPGRLQLTDFWDRVTVLGETITREVTRHRLPVAMESLRRGESARFGDLTVQATGLSSQQRGHLPWAEIEKVQVRDGLVQIRKAGKWLSWSDTRVAHIPNVFVFLALVQTMHPDRGR